MARVEAGKLAKTQARLNRLEANRKRQAGAEAAVPRAKRPKPAKPAKPAKPVKSAKSAKDVASGGPSTRSAGVLGVVDKAEKMRTLNLKLDAMAFVANQDWCRRMGNSVPPTPLHLAPYI